MKKNGLFIVLILSFVSVFAQKGNLVVVGGALQSGNADIYNKFIGLSEYDGKQKIGIIPAASGLPSKNGNKFKKNLINYGVSEENIVILPLSLIDDETTPLLDESNWIENANDDKVVEQIENCTAIWFIGGDQMRITQLLLNKNKKPTKALSAIWNLYEQGGVIGGTSAGAAIMSKEMICGGTSMGALFKGVLGEYTSEEKDDYNAICLDKGLGFFPHGIVDQHFDKRARIGRLLVSAIHFKTKYPIAIGVNENSAFVYYASEKKLEFFGGVTFLDISKAKTYKNQKNYSNIEISYFSDGDVYDLNTDTCTVQEWKKATVGNEYYNSTEKVRGGVLSGGNTFFDLLTAGLMDNKALKSVKSYSFDDSGNGFEINLTQTNNSKAFWGRNKKGEECYNVQKVVMDIVPVKIKIEY